MLFHIDILTIVALRQISTHRIKRIQHIMYLKRQRPLFIQIVIKDINNMALRGVYSSMSKSVVQKRITP